MPIHTIMLCNRNDSKKSVEICVRGNTGIKKFFVALVIGVFTLGMFSSDAISESVNCTDLPSLDFKQSTLSSGEYAIWVLAKTETTTATPYISVDGKSCDKVALPESTDWEWVSGRGGVIKKDLSFGEHTYSFSVNEGAVLADKVIVTSDLDCIPKDNGDNCLDQTLAFELVGGLQQGSTVAGEQKVQALLTKGAGVEGNSIEFLIDDEKVSTQSSEPFCLVDIGDDESCGLYNFSTLPKGKHTLKAVGYQAGEIASEKSITFTVADANSATLSLSDLSLSAETNADKPDSLTIDVDGISPKEIVSGELTISAEVEGSSAPITVYFAINNIDMNSSSKAPYCMVAGSSDTCGAWDSSSLVNGDYTLQVAATAPDARNKYVSIPFRIDNSQAIYKVGTSRQEIIVGNPNQQVTGSVRVTLPETQLKNAQRGRKIEYYVDDKSFASTYDSNPVVALSSSDYSNGEHTLSAKVTSVQGETTSLQSTIKIQNDMFTSSLLWLRDNLVATLAVTVVSIVGMYLVIYTLRKKKNNKYFNLEHNISEGYVYAETYGAFSPKNKNTQSLAAFTVLFVGITVVLGSGGTGTGVKTGFAQELDFASTAGNFSGFNVQYDKDHMTDAHEHMQYMRLNYSKDVSESTADAVVYKDAVDFTEDKATKKGGLISNVDVTTLQEFEGETMNFAPGVGRVSADKEAHSGQSMHIEKSGKVYRNQRMRKGRRFIIRARAGKCARRPFMRLRINKVDIGEVEVKGDKQQDYEFRVNLSENSHNFEISFRDEDDDGDKNQRGKCARGIFIDRAHVPREENDDEEVDPTAPTPIPETPEAPTPTPTNPEPEPAPEVPTEPETPVEPTPTPTPTIPDEPTPTPTEPEPLPEEPTEPDTPVEPTPTPTPTTPTPTPSNDMGPNIDESLLPPPVAGYASELISQTGATPTYDAEIGAFRTSCTVSHFAYDDPIVFPGVPGASHLHTFFGNTGVNAYSTADSIEKTGNSTCSGGILNRTGYWMPSMINTRTGGPVFPIAVLVYYKTSYYGVQASTVQQPPAQLRMIAGNPSATTVQESDPYGHHIVNFACNSQSDPFPPGDQLNPSVSDAYCPEGWRRLFMEVRFPQCWDGVNLDSSTHRSHMSYPTGSGCPSSHPVGLPEIQLRVEYDYNDPDRQYWRLSSDYYEGGGGGYSNHADWWNGWNQDLLTRIRTTCWNANMDCHVDMLGNGEQLTGPPEYPYD
jgi:hypothetical protein